MNKTMTEERTYRKIYISYMVGFGLSLALTMAAFWMVAQHLESTWLQKEVLIAAISIMAVVQLIVQLVFFFHLGREQKPRLNSISFLFMLMVVVIIGFGSLWIMYNLNYNMMPDEVETYIQEEENIKLEKTERNQ